MNSYCIAPFIKINQEPGGRYRVCHWHKNNLEKEYDSIQDAFLGEEMESLRTKMLNNEYIEDCSKCYKTEELGISSHRQSLTDIHSNFVSSATGRIKNLEISFDNACNFKCVSCAPDASSAWEDDVKEDTKEDIVDVDDDIKEDEESTTKETQTDVEMGLQEETPENGGSENEGRTSGQVKGSGTRTGTREERAMLDAIAFAEGTRDQVDNGYRTHFGFDTFDDYSKHPDIVKRAGGYESTAAGRYQFLTTTWNRFAKRLGLKDFSPINQDLAAIAYAKDLGVTQALLKKEGMSAEVSRRLGRAWAGMAGSNLNQPQKSLASIQKAYEASLGAQPKPTTPPPAPLPQNKNGIVYLPGGKYALFGGQRYSVDPNNPEDLLYPEDGRTTPSQNELDYASKQAQKASGIKQVKQEPIAEPKTNRKASDPFFDPRTGGTLKPGMKVDIKKSYSENLYAFRKQRPRDVFIIKEKEFITQRLPMPGANPMENQLNTGSIAMVNNTSRALNGIG